MTLVSRAASVFALAVSVLPACTTTTLGPPPDAPRAERALDAMPGDLDVVLRLDLKRIRETLGGPAMSDLAEQAVRGLHGQDRATDELLVHALAQTDTLWVGLRPVKGLAGADSVFILQGHFAQVDPHAIASTPAFDPPLDLGGAFLRYDRKPPKARSALARIYTRGDDLIVGLSEAEIDSVERSLEQHRGAPPLEPAAKGALSVVANPSALPIAWLDAAPALERLSRVATRLELNADLTSVGANVSLSLRFEDSDTASRLASALTEMRDALRGAPGRIAKIAAKTELTSAAQYVTLHLVVGRDELAEIVNCQGSACAW